MIKAGIIGGTGYTGVELLRLLARHPGVELTAITSRGEAGTASVAAASPCDGVYLALNGRRPGSGGSRTRTARTW